LDSRRRKRAKRSGDLTPRTRPPMGDAQSCSEPAPQSQPVASAPRLATFSRLSVAFGLKVRMLAAGPAHPSTLLLFRRLCEQVAKLNIPKLRFRATVIEEPSRASRFVALTAHRRHLQRGAAVNGGITDSRVGSAPTGTLRPRAAARGQRQAARPGGRTATHRCFSNTSL
jgi:hypothetical protein